MSESDELIVRAATLEYPPGYNWPARQEGTEFSVISGVLRKGLREALRSVECEKTNCSDLREALAAAEIRVASEREKLLVLCDEIEKHGPSK